MGSNLPCSAPPTISRSLSDWLDISLRPRKYESEGARTSASTNSTLPETLNWLAILNAIQLLPGAPLVPLSAITFGLFGLGSGVLGFAHSLLLPIPCELVVTTLEMEEVELTKSGNRN